MCVYIEPNWEAKPWRGSLNTILQAIFADQLTSGLAIVAGQPGNNSTCTMARGDCRIQKAHSMRLRNSQAPKNRNCCVASSNLPAHAFGGLPTRRLTIPLDRWLFGDASGAE